MSSNSEPTSSTQHEKQHSYFDDSSSEEDDNNVTRTQYDVIDQFKKFCESEKFITAEQSDKYKSAFYSHTLGIQILRHPTVMKYYSKDKKEYLMLSNQVVKVWI